MTKRTKHAARMRQSDIDRIVSTWVGTPYRYQESTPKKGVDCVHLISAILAEMGIHIALPAYPRGWRHIDNTLFHRWLEENPERYEKINRTEIQFGDVILIGHHGMITHAAACVSYANLIHIVNGGDSTVRVEPIRRYTPETIMIIRVKRG